MDAVEKKQYGWFWSCPNGGKECHYRHALPPGYILKSQMKALLEEESDKIPIEEEIENQVTIIFDLLAFTFPFNLVLVVGTCLFDCSSICSIVFFALFSILSSYNCSSAKFLACKSKNHYSNDSRPVLPMEEQKDRGKRGWLSCTESRQG